MNATLRHVKFDGYYLITRDSGRCDRRGQTYISYELIAPDGSAIFEGSDFAGSPMNSDDSDETLRNLLGFLTLRLGDTDREYFDSYTPEQISFRDGPAEHLSMWALEDGPEFQDVSEFHEGILTGNNKLIGRLIGNHVKCNDCAKGQGTKLYEANIRPYKQTCHSCGKVLVESIACELFEKPNCEQLGIEQ